MSNTFIMFQQGLLDTVYFMYRKSSLETLGIFNLDFGERSQTPGLVETK